jgi:hypothetical protein
MHAAAASVLLPVAAKPGFAALADLSSHWDYVFFDERFENAHRIAERWSAFTQPTAVHGDITALWGNGLERMVRDHALRLRGVTMQSFIFCLRILADEHADLDAQVSRVDLNLFAWTLRTMPRTLHAERRHG